MKKFKKIGILLCVCYVIAYILSIGIENWQVKNEFEKQKIESYSELYQKQFKK